MRFVLGGNERGVPATTIFGDVALGKKINIDEAKALAVTFGPFVLVLSASHAYN